MSIIVAAACLWGTGGITAQYLYDSSDLSPIAVGFYRLAIAAGVVLAVGLTLLPRERLVLPTGTLAGVVAVGVGLGVYQACYFAAVQVVGVSVATLATVGLAPIFVTFGSVVLFGEKIGARVLVALVAALSGLALLVWDPSGVGIRPGIISGVSFAVGSALGFSGVTLVSRSLSTRVDSFRLTLFGFTIGAIILLPLAAYSGLTIERAHLSVAPLLYLGIVPTAAAYGLFFSGLRMVRSSVASILTLLEPLTATVLAGIIFGERLGITGVVGGALLLSAVIVLYVGHRRF